MNLFEETANRLSSAKCLEMHREYEAFKRDGTLCDGILRETVNDILPDEISPLFVFQCDQMMTAIYRRYALQAWGLAND